MDGREQEKKGAVGEELGEEVNRGEDEEGKDGGTIN